MKYKLLIYAEEKSLADGERERCYAESVQLCYDLQARGQYMSANPLQPVATASRSSPMARLPKRTNSSAATS